MPNLKSIILRSPLLSFSEKKTLLAKLPSFDQQEQTKLETALLESEKNLFEELQKAGLNAEEFKRKLANFFRKKLNKVEEKEKTHQLTGLAKQIKNL